MGGRAALARAGRLAGFDRGRAGGGRQPEDEGQLLVFRRHDRLALPERSRRRRTFRQRGPVDAVELAETGLEAR